MKAGTKACVSHQISTHVYIVMPEYLYYTYVHGVTIILIFVDFVVV